jgi:CBS domain containing-hemolysin-like protein
VRALGRILRGVTLFLLSIGCALGISFLCSLMEAALLSLTPSQVAELSQKHPRAGEIWRGFKKRIDRPIAVILILNTTAHTIGASVAGAQFDELFGDQWIWVFSLAFTFLMLQFTEILPKTLGVKFNRQLAAAVAVPLAVATRIAEPFVWLLHLLNRPFEGKRNANDAPATVDEIQSLAAMARMTKDIDIHQERIIQGAARLSKRKVRELMIPIEQVVMLSTSQSLAKAIVAAHMDAHTRFPVCLDGDRTKIQGYVNFKEMIYFMSTNPADPTLKGVMRPITFIDEGCPATDLMKVFIDEHEHIAIVRGTDGKPLGLVTLEDMMEELFGDLGDEFDRLPKYAHAMSKGTWMFGGGTPMGEVSAATGGVLAASNANFATWLEAEILQEFGVAPSGGQTIRRNGVDVLIRRVRRGRVFEASVVVG